MKAFATLGLLGSIVATALAAPTNYDYGKRCAEELGVEVPPMSCLDPASTLLPITQNGVEVASMVESCDKPALLTPDKACIPGARLRKFRQTNARGEPVTTMLFCRRTRTGASRLSPSELYTDPHFNDIGLIQYNEKSHKACWFFMEEDEAGKDARVIPRPYSASWRGARDNAEARKALAFWTPVETTAGGRCIKCHDSGVWIRSPFVAQAKGTANAVPPNPQGIVRHVEVGRFFRDWNGDEGPLSIRIQADRYESLLPPEGRADYESRLTAGTIAPLDKCTSCHRLGKSRQDTYRGLGTCGYILDSAVGGDTGRLLTPNPWMPPYHGRSRAEWEDYYGYALSAARYCCNHPFLVDGGNHSVCQSE